MPNESIYIISTPSKAKKNKFKPGRHSGCQTKLTSRYQTYFITPIIFFYRPVSNAIKIESIIKSKLKKYRIKRSNGSRTEWVIFDLSKLSACINKIIDDFENNENIYNNIEDIDNDSEDIGNDNDDINNDSEDIDDDNINENNHMIHFINKKYTITGPTGSVFNMID